MALIRHAQAERIARDAIVLDLGDVRAQAAFIIEQARAQAERIVADARAERERLVAGAAEQGHAEGFARGHAEGVEAGRVEGSSAALAERRDELGRLESAWNGALESFAARRDDLICDAQESVLRLALAIAERVTRRVVETDPGIARDQIRQAIAMAVGASRLAVVVAPEDEELAREAVPAIMASLGSSAHAEVRVDADLSRGSCVVRTPSGEIDASVETLLSRIASALVPEPSTGDARSEPA